MHDKMRKLFIVQKHSNPENIRNMKKINWLLALGFGLVFFCFCLFWVFHGTKNTDEGFYLFCTRLFSQGYQPYRDFGFTQPPLVLLFDLPFLKLFGYSLMGVRLASMVAVLLGFIPCSIFLFAKKDEKAAFIYIFLNLMAIGWLVVSMKGRNYALAGTLILFSTSVRYLGTTPVLQWMLFSFFSALAVATRYPSLWFLMPLAFVYLSDIPDWRKRIVCVLGSVLWGIFVVWSISFGDWRSFWFWTVDYHLDSTINVKKELELLQFLSLAPTGFGMLVIGIFMTVSRRRFREFTLLLFCFFVFISGFFSPRYYGEYPAIYIPSLLFLLTQVFHPYLRGLEVRHLAIGAMVLFTLNCYAYQKVAVSSPVSYDVVKRATEAAEFLEDQTSPGDLVMASVIEIPMQANRGLPLSYSMGVFSVSNTLKQSERSFYNINSPSELLSILADDNVKALVLNTSPRGNFRWSIPTIEFFPDFFYEKFGKILDEYWELAYLNEDYVVLLPKI